MENTENIELTPNTATETILKPKQKRTLTEEQRLACSNRMKMVNEKRLADKRNTLEQLKSKPAVVEPKPVEVKPVEPLEIQSSKQEVREKPKKEKKRRVVKVIELSSSDDDSSSEESEEEIIAVKKKKSVKEVKQKG